MGKPQKMSDGMYKQAIENNPDRAHLAPVLAEGFKDLKARLATQHKAQQGLFLLSFFQFLQTTKPLLKILRSISRSCDKVIPWMLLSP
jgi:hypothetical protein